MDLRRSEFKAHRARLACLFLAVATLAVYLPTARFDFVNYDDPRFVTDNPHVLTGLTPGNIAWAFRFGEGDYWHPITWLSLMLDVSLFGRDAGAMHAINALIHALNVALVFLLLRRWTGALWRGAAVAALFALHPLRVESVAWVTERKDVLSALFWLLSLGAYGFYVGKRGATGNSAPDRSGFSARNAKFAYGFALLFFALALMSKAMAVTLPVTLLLLDYWPFRRIGPEAETAVPGETRRPKLRTLIGEKLPFFALALASCAITYAGQKRAFETSMTAGGLSSSMTVSLPPDLPGSRVGNALVACLQYLGKVIWPVNLSVNYPRPDHWPIMEVFSAVVVVVLLSAVVILLGRRRRYLIFGWFWFLVTIAPVLGLTKGWTQYMADRFTYMPLLGLFVVAAWAAGELALRGSFARGLAAGMMTLIIAACLVRTLDQLRFWRNSETLFRHALAVTQNNSPALCNLAAWLEQQNRFDEALAEYREALRISETELSRHGLTPRDRATAHVNLGAQCEKWGLPQDALVEYRDAAAFDPTWAGPHKNAGSLLGRLNQPEEALQEVTVAARLAPADPEPPYLAGKMELSVGKIPDALVAFRESIRRGPDFYPALTFLARVLASDRDSTIRNGAEAVRLAERANEVTKGTQPMVLDTLAMAYAEAGRFSDAAHLAQRAVEAARANGLNEAVDAMEARRNLYQSGKPFRADFAPVPEPSRKP